MLMGLGSAVAAAGCSSIPSQFHLRWQRLSHNCRLPLRLPFRSRSSSLFIGRQTTPVASLMDLAATEKNNLDLVIEQEYDHQAKLLQEFYEIPSIDKAWVSQSCLSNGLQAMISMSQMNLPANKKRTFFLSAHIPEEVGNPTNCHWSPFPVDQTGASLVVPSPSGLNVLVVRNGESSSKDASPPVQLEIWGRGQLRKEIFVPQSVHGPLYTDGWFEGVSWSPDETCIAYIAEEPATHQPIFTSSGCKPVTSGEKEPGSWKGQGDWLEDWGETYSGKRRPALFVVNIKSGTVQVVEGIPDNLSVGQVVWAPHVSTNDSQYLVFVGWSVDSGDSHNPRKLGMKYCYNRPCALYAVRAPLPKWDSSKEMIAAQKLTEKIDSAFLPRFSPDGELLVFLSASAAVNTGAHCATNSLHSLHWPSDGTMHPSIGMNDVVSLVMCPREGCFPGLYCTNVLSSPWLSDGCSLVLSSIWGSMQVLLAINVVSGEVSRISPENSNSSWSALAVHDNIVLAVSSSPANPPKLKYGCPSRVDTVNDEKTRWSWLDIPIPVIDYSEKVKASLSSIEFEILKIPVKDQESLLTEGAKQPFEAIFVSSRFSSESESQERACNPLIVILHGGPHSTSLTSFSRAQAFLSSLGYNLLYVNYRGSLGFGEEALQSLPGNVGRQDVADVLNAVDLVIRKGLAIPTNIVVLGGSHGGFLATHLIGQAPDRFVAAAVRNPVCNLSLMVGTTDIPDWCYVEAYGKNGKNAYTEAPSIEDLTMFYQSSPISHVSKVKVPVLFLLGAQDLRVPVSNGLQYARTLREQGVEVKVIVFPNDVHSIDIPSISSQITHVGEPQVQTPPRNPSLNPQAFSTPSSSARSQMGQDAPKSNTPLTYQKRKRKKSMSNSDIKQEAPEPIAIAEPIVNNHLGDLSSHGNVSSHSSGRGRRKKNIIINNNTTDNSGNKEAMGAHSVGFPVDSLTEEEIESGVVSTVGGTEQANYIVIRNHILGRWRDNVNAYLSKEQVMGSTPAQNKNLVSSAYNFLLTHGYINFGVAPAIKSVIPVEATKGNVVVIGAGLAGLAAARQLLSSGFKVIIVEGRKRPGGRVYTKKMAVGITAAAADLGGSVLTGIHGNPLGVLARQLSYPLHKVRDKCPLYQPDGQPVNVVVDAKVEEAFNKLLDKAGQLRQLMGEVAVDISLGTALETFRKVYGVAEEVEEGRLFNWHLANLEYANAGLLLKLSLAFWDQDDPYEMGGDHCFLPGGNGRLIQALTENLPIFYEKTVHTIRYGSDGVQVLAGSQVFQGDMVLCTVPLGVLKSNSIRFIPELPQRKIDAIKRLGFGLLNKVAMLFPHVFWGAELDTFGHLCEDTSRRGEFFLFYSYAAVSGGPLLIALVAGDAAIKFESMPATDAVTRVLEILKGIYCPRGIDVPDPIQTVCTRWGTDPYSLGSYSHVAVGASGDDYDILAESVGEGRLFFAGEATNRRYPATMHGAFLSGLREAANISNAATARSIPSKVERGLSKDIQSYAALLADLFRQPDLEFGSFSVLFDPQSNDPKSTALLRVMVGGTRRKGNDNAKADQQHSNKLIFQQPQSHFNQQQQLHVYTLISQQQALELREVRGGDENRLRYLYEKLGVKLVGRRGLGTLGDSLVASIKSARAARRPISVSSPFKFSN